MIRVGSRYPKKLYRGSRAVDILARGGRPIWISAPAQKTALRLWLEEHARTVASSPRDAVGQWFEVEITLPAGWTGNAVDGYTGPMKPGASQTMTLDLHHSTDLQSWTTGEWIDAPGKPAETLPDGRKRFYARYTTIPAKWFAVLVDLTVSCARYGKAITSIHALGTDISLPGYPYAMPAQAATLQTHLRAAGYTGAVVSSISKPLTLTVKHHEPGYTYVYHVTLSGTNVTGVADRFQNPITSGMSYPYSMPNQRALLQTHLRAAGHPGAVCTLYADEWTITLPDRSAGEYRPFHLQFTPGDPFPHWNMFGEYLGESAASAAAGAFTNLRNPSGAALQEAARGFARLGFRL